MTNKNILLTLVSMLVSMLVFIGFQQTALAVDVEYVDKNGGRAPFSNPIRVGNMLYLSGALGFNKERKLPAGCTAPETALALASIKNTLEENSSSMDQVVKCTVFMADFGAMNAEYTKAFTGKRPARSAMTVKGLFSDAYVEIEYMAWVDTK